MALRTKGPITLQEFSAALKLTKLNDDGIFGIGLSGEAKSWALLLLLKQAVGKERVVAFTVDHKLKPDSTALAAKIHSKVTKLGIEHHILPVNWEQTGSGFRGDDKDPPLAHRGSSLSYWDKGQAARIRRYALLSRACKQRGIHSLLLGYSLDDQIRIGLRRLKWNSGIEGLAGMKSLEPEVPVTTATAAKHVRLVRPMLSFSQERLEETCRELGIEPQKATNNDLLFLPTENPAEIVEAAEKMNSLEGDNSPVRALSKEAVARFMEHMEIHRRAFKVEVAPLIREFTLRDPPTGTCFLQVRANEHNLKNHWISKPHLAERVIAHVVNWASNMWTAPLSTVSAGIRKQILNYFKFKSRMIAGSGVVLCPPRSRETGAFIWVVARAPLRMEEYPELVTELRIGERALWDRRFFIALRPAQGDDAAATFYGVNAKDLTFVIRAFTDRDHDSILNRMRASPRTQWSEYVQQAVIHYCKKMPKPVRNTIPCVALKQDDGDTSYVICVPSLSINLEPGLVDVQFSFAKHSTFEREKEEVGFRLLRDEDINNCSDSTQSR